MQVLYLPGYSSGNPYLRQLQSHLADEDVDVVIPEGSAAISIFGLFSLFPILGAVHRYGKPDVLHLHWLHPFIVAKDRSSWLSGPLAVQFFLELLVLKALGVRIVWTVHNLKDHERRAGGTEMVVRHGLGRLADSIVVHGESVVDTVMDAYRLPERARQKFVAIQHGNYLDNYPNEVSRESAREFVDADDDETVFVYFGRIRPYKNVPELVRTFRELDDEKLRLVVVGMPNSDALASEIERLAGDDERISLVLEFVDNEDVQLYMNAADAVVLPFSEILTSGSTILAMSFGRAVVVPDIGCVGELTAHDPAQASITYDPADPDGLRQAMCTVRDVDTEAIGAANRTFAKSLDWETVAERTASVYRGAYPRTERPVPVATPAD
jgi:beta-1,4-mannosyltransferase